MVQRFDADLGIAFDGDGDRLGVVTKSGENIFPDRLLMLFAADVLERNPGAVIVYDVKCTGRLQGHILRHGGSPLMWKTGHSLIKAKMRETEAELAGEMSGHFFFGERWYGFDDGIYAAARLLEILAARPESPTEVLTTLPTGVATPEIKVDAPGGDPHGFVERFVAQARFEGGARPSTIDGLRVDFADGWGLVRASNTTPVLVLRFDADSEEALARIQAQFREQLLAVDPGLALPFGGGAGGLSRPSSPGSAPGPTPGRCPGRRGRRAGGPGCPAGAAGRRAGPGCSRRGISPPAAPAARVR